MNELIKESMMTLFIIILVIIVTHTLFFMVYGWCVGGDPLIALENFYDNMYNIRW